MQTIKKDELFKKLGGFLRSKGIDVTEGSYASTIQKGCNVLTNVINAADKTAKQAKVKVGEAVDEVRQVIHEKTAPQPAPQKPPQKKTSSSANSDKKRTAPRAKKKSGRKV